MDTFLGKTAWGWMCVLVWTVCTGTVAETPAPMNIVFLLADDLGGTDLACYGSPLHQTPHIDRMAKEGVRFTEAYSPACSCSPSRASIVTGKYPARLGMTAIIEKHRGDSAPPDAPFLPAPTKPYLPREELTLAEAMKTCGYTTALVGKWHLGADGHGPKDHGFDVAIAPPHRGMPASYFWPQWKGNPEMEGRFEGEYLTDRLAFEACQFIEENREKPFFLLLAFHSVHVPIEAKKEKVAKYETLIAQLGDQELQHRNPHYAGMVESLDDAVGTVLDTLDVLKLEDRTLVVFSSDNGGLVHPSHVGEHTPATSNAPLRSGKGFVYEGGIRVPLIIRWPGVTPTGATCTAPVHGMDLFPTLCGMAQVDIESLPIPGRLDGMDLRPLLEEPGRTLPDRTLFWHYPHFSSMGGRPSGAVRSGRWKLVEHFETDLIELYDLERDDGESQDLSRRYPEQAAALRAELAAWRAEVNALMPSQPNPAYKAHRPQ